MESWNIVNILQNRSTEGTGTLKFEPQEGFHCTRSLTRPTSSGQDVLKERIFNMERSLIYKVTRALRKYDLLFKDDLSHLIHRVKKREQTYFWSTYASVQEFLIFHSDIFIITPSGLLGCVPHDVVETYVNSSCNSKVPSPEISLCLEKQCLRRVCRVIYSGFYGNINDKDLSILLSSMSDRQKNYFWNTYSSVQEFIHTHMDVFRVQGNGMIRSISQQMLKMYLKKAFGRKFQDCIFRRKNSIANVALDHQQPTINPNLSCDVSHHFQQTPVEHFTDQGKSTEEQVEVIQNLKITIFTQDEKSEPNNTRNDAQGLRLSSVNSDVQCRNLNSDAALPVRSINEERSLLHFIQQALKLRVFNIGEDLSYLLPTIPSQYTQYFRYNYSSVNNFIIFHSDIFNIQEDGEIRTSSSKKDVKEYVESNCHCRVSFPENDLTKEKQCVSKISEILNSAHPPYVHMEYPFILYTKLTKDLQSHLSKNYTSVQNFINFHKDVFPVDSDGQVNCVSPESVERYVNSSAEWELKEAYHGFPQNPVGFCSQYGNDLATRLLQEAKHDSSSTGRNQKLNVEIGHQFCVETSQDSSGNIIIQDSRSSSKNYTAGTNKRGNCLSANKNPAFSLPVRSVTEEGIALYEIRQRLCSRSFNIDADLNFLFPKRQSKCSEYFFSKYSSVKEFINFHSDIFRIKEDGEISCQSKDFIKEYLRTDCNWKVSFPENDLQNEKQCLHSMFKVLSSFNSLHIHIFFPYVLYFKLPSLLQLHLLKNYHSMQDFFGTHSEIFSVDVDGLIQLVSKKKVRQYTRRLTMQKLDRARQCFRQYPESSFSRQELGTSLTDPDGDSLPEVGVDQMEEDNVPDDVEVSPRMQRLVECPGRLPEPGNVDCRVARKEASTQTTSTGPILSIMMHNDTI